MSEHGKSLRPELTDQNNPAKGESPKPEVDTEATKISKSETVSPIGDERMGTGKRFQDGRPRAKK